MNYIESYGDIKKMSPISVREYMRSAVLTGLSLLDQFRDLESQIKKPRVQFLYIHHVFKDEENSFRVLLNKLKQTHTFISYSEAISKILNGEIDKSYITISTDDGFKNNLKAAEILNEFGAKACFFINPSIIGETNNTKVTEYCNNTLQFPTVEFLNWNDIGVLQKTGHEIGSHTMDHIMISENTLEVITKDMELSYQTLKEKCGDVKHFAFPYGRFFHFNEIARKACFDAGFMSCATAERGCHINHDKELKPHELCVLRDHIMLDWDINHIMYFLGRNSRNVTPQNNLFPY